MAAGYDEDVVLNVGLNTDKVKSVADSLTNDLESAFNKFSGKKLDSTFLSMLSNMGKVIQKSQQLQAHLQELESVKIPTDEYSAITSNLEKLEAEYDKLRQKREELLTQQQSLQYEKVPTKEYANLEKQLESLRAKLQRANDAKVKFEDLGGDKNSNRYKSMLYDLRQLQGRINVTKFNMEELVAENKAFTNSAAYNKVTGQLNDVNSKLTEVVFSQDKLLQQKAELEDSGQAFISGADTQEYSNLVGRLNDVNNQMVVYRQKVREASKEHGKLKIAISIFKGIFNVLKTVDKQVRKVIISIAKLVANLAKMAGSKILGGIKKLGGAITSLGKNTGGASNMFEHGFKSFIRYGLGVRSIFALINKLRRALIEGFENLAQVHEPFNQAMSNIISALNLLKNSFASAFAPIIETVEPILTRLILKLSEAVSLVGQFIAAITGKQFVKAGLVQTQYAKSTDDTADAENKAAKAEAKRRKEAEKLKKTLAGFDDVEILKGPDDDNDSDSGSGSGSASPDFSFSTAPIESAVSDFAKRILDAWKNADFYEIGQIVGQKLKDALDRIPWANIKTVLRRIAKSIATFLNGFLEVPGLFDSIGRTIAEAINSAFEFVESFVSNFHWDSLGNAIKDLIISTLTNIDWPLIYQTMTELGAGIGEALNTIITDPTLWSTLFTSAGNLISSVLSGIDAFLQGVDWGLTGSAIGQGLNDAINNFDWSIVSQTLIDLINGAFDLWYNFVTTFDFTKFGEHIGTTLSTVINGIDWKKGAASVAETMNGLLEALNAFMQETDFKSIGKGVVDTIGTFLNTFDWKELGEFLKNCLQALCDFFLGIYEEIDWENLPDQILTKMAEFMEGFDWKETVKKVLDVVNAEFDAKIKFLSGVGQALHKNGEGIINGILDGIIYTVKGITSWITDHIFNPFTSAFNKVFGIESNSASQMKDSGKAIPEGVKTGVEDKWSVIGSFVKDHFPNVKDAFKNAFGINNGSASKLEASGEAIPIGVKKGVSNKWSMIGNYAKDHTSNITNAFKTAFGINNNSASKFEKSGEAIPIGVKKGVANKWSTIGNYIQNHLHEIKDAFNGDGSWSWSDIGANIVSGIEYGLNGQESSLSITAWNLAVSAYNSMVTALDIGSPSKLFRDNVGKMIPAGMALGILDNAGLVDDAMTDLTDTVTDAGKKALEIPAVVKGGVVPYQATVSSQTESALENIVDALETSVVDRLTGDDLESILIEVLQTYLNISFYLGDEQIARHANSGNLKLGRRYSTIRTGEV